MTTNVVSTVAENGVVAEAIAVYWTSTPGMRVFVGPDYPEAQAGGGFLFFAPTGRHHAHPLAVGDTMQVEGFMVVRNPSLIRALDAMAETGAVPFIRHPNPVLIDGLENVGVPTGVGAQPGA